MEPTPTDEPTEAASESQAPRRRAEDKPTFKNWASQRWVTITFLSLAAAFIITLFLVLHDQGKLSRLAQNNHTQQGQLEQVVQEQSSGRARAIDAFCGVDEVFIQQLGGLITQSYLLPGDHISKKTHQPVEGKLSKALERSGYPHIQQRKHMAGIIAHRFRDAVRAAILKSAGKTATGGSEQPINCNGLGVVSATNVGVRKGEPAPPKIP